MKHYHLATKEWIESNELQKRLDRHFDFRCNECGKSIGEHIGTVADGIFCPSCKQKAIDVIMSHTQN